jgi:hypothetical protein
MATKKNKPLDPPAGGPKDLEDGEWNKWPEEKPWELSVDGEPIDPSSREYGSYIKPGWSGIRQEAGQGDARAMRPAGLPPTDVSMTMEPLQDFQEGDVRVEVGRPLGLRPHGKDLYYIPNPNERGKLSNVGQQEFEDYKSYASKQRALEEVRKKYAKEKKPKKKNPSREEEE